MIEADAGHIPTQEKLNEQLHIAAPNAANMEATLQHIPHLEQAAFFEESTKQANEIFDTLKIPTGDALEPHEVGGTPLRKDVEKRRLERAVDTANEALAIGYDPEANDDALTDKAGDILEDFINYTDEVRRTGKSTDPEYATRRPAKKLILESAVRELGRRHGLDGQLSGSNLLEIQRLTGIPVKDAHVISERMIVSPRQPQDESKREGIIRASHVQHGGTNYPVHAIDPSIGERGGYVVRDPKSGRLQRIHR